MNHLVGYLENPNYFGSGGYNTPEFDSFFEKFKKSLTYQLKRVGASEIEFSKGYFYISGFFTVKDNSFYFSLSDVSDWSHQRDWKGKIQLLMRTAKDYKDYSGGANNYVTIQNGMYKEIARKFRLDTSEVKKTVGKTREELVDIIMERGFLNRTFPSVSKATSVAFELHRRLKTNNQTVTSSKYGRSINRAYVEREEFTFNVDGETKRASFYLGNITDEQLIASIKMPKTNEYRTNPYSGEGCELTPLEAGLYDTIKEWERLRHPLFQQALFIFRSRFGEKYYTLLD